jgi:hypothetical protein
MNRLTKTILSLAAATSASVALAGAPPHGRVTDLEAAQAKLERYATRTKGGPQQRLLLERERIQGMIDDLNAGKNVDADDLDRALHNAEHPGF